MPLLQRVQYVPPTTPVAVHVAAFAATLPLVLCPSADIDLVWLQVEQVDVPVAVQVAAVVVDQLCVVEDTPYVEHLEHFLVQYVALEPALYVLEKSCPIADPDVPPHLVQVAADVHEAEP